jgi:hypothetical protein
VQCGPRTNQRWKRNNPRPRRDTGDFRDAGEPSPGTESQGDSELPQQLLRLILRLGNSTRKTPIQDKVKIKVPIKIKIQVQIAHTFQISFKIPISPNSREKPSY